MTIRVPRRPHSPALTFFVLVVSSLLAGSSRVQAVTDAEIDTIRKRNVLDDRDKEMISLYVQERLERMRDAKNPDTLPDLRADLLARRASEVRSDEAAQAYSDTFAAAVKAGYPQLLQAAPAPADDDNPQTRLLAQQVPFNVTLILAETDNPLLLDDLLKMLDSDLLQVRYWSLRGLAMPTLHNELALADSQNTPKVLQSLEQLLTRETNAMVLKQIALTAALPEHEAAMQLLQKCVQKRLDVYANWTVTEEGLDLGIIEVLLDMVRQDPLQNNQTLQSALLRKAAELFTAAFDRYSIGMNYDNNGEILVLLSPESQWDLAKVLIDGEGAFLQAAESIRNRQFYSALLANRPQDLDRAYDMLLGIDGDVNRTFALFSDNDPDRPLPPLPQPTPEFIEHALNRAKIKDNLIKTES